MTLRQPMESVIKGAGDPRATRRAVLTLALPIVGSDLLQRGACHAQTREPRQAKDQWYRHRNMQDVHPHHGLEGRPRIAHALKEGGHEV